MRKKPSPKKNKSKNSNSSGSYDLCESKNFKPKNDQSNAPKQLDADAFHDFDYTRDRDDTKLAPVPMSESLSEIGDDQKIVCPRLVIKPPVFKLKPVEDPVFAKERNDVLAQIPGKLSNFAAVQSLMALIAACENLSQLQNFLRWERDNYPVVSTKVSFYCKIVDDCIKKADECYVKKIEARVVP